MKAFKSLLWIEGKLKCNVVLEQTKYESTHVFWVSLLSYGTTEETLLEH